MQKGRRACLPAGKGRVGGLDGLVFGTDALAQGLGSMARTARSLPPYGRGAAAKIQITSPPFTPSTCPVIYPAFSSHKNTIARATSSAVPKRSTGVSSAKAARSSSVKAGHHVGVNDAGRDDVHRHAAGAFLFGKGAAQADQPCFGSAVGYLAAAAVWPHILLMSTMRPYFCRIMPAHGAAGIKCTVQIHGPSCGANPRR